MSHTFTGPQGTTFIFNSDLSGMVQVTGVANFRGNSEIPGADLVAFHAHVTKGEQRVALSDYEAMREQARVLETTVPDRERIEFIRRAYLARLASHPDPTRMTCINGNGVLYGTDALRHLAEQDWEAVKVLEAKPDDV